MTLTLITPPIEEPVALADLKQHLRVDQADEDVLIAQMGLSARMICEQICQRNFMTQEWQWQLDQWPERIRQEGEVLPLSPVQNITSVQILDETTQSVVLPSSDYVFTSQEPSKLIMMTAPVPGIKTGGIKINMLTGYGQAAQVPAPIKQAILTLTAHYYERREPYENNRLTAVPDLIYSLLGPYRIVTL
ncbi:MAG: head-tail connector protein [bacterium]